MPLPQKYMEALADVAKMAAGDLRKSLNGRLVRTEDYFPEVPPGLIPPDQWMVPTGRPGLQDDPDSVYPNAQLPCLDQTFALPFTDDPANSRLVITQADLQAITLLSTGFSDPGDALGFWWTQTYADSTVQRDGQLVFDGHTFWGTAHSLSFEGLGVREGTGVATDALRFGSLLSNGAGSYAEQILLAAGTRIGLQIIPQGSQCPSYLGNLAYTGDQGQVVGAGLPTVSDPQLPFKRWERPYNFGSRDSAYKSTLNLTMGPSEIRIPYIAGNPPPGDLYAFWRLRICGFRHCGKYVPGCPITTKEV